MIHFFFSFHVSHIRVLDITFVYWIDQYQHDICNTYQFKRLMYDLMLILGHHKRWFYRRYATPQSNNCVLLSSNNEYIYLLKCLEWTRTLTMYIFDCFQFHCNEMDRCNYTRTWRSHESFSPNIDRLRNLRMSIPKKFYRSFSHHFSASDSIPPTIQAI